MTKLIKIDIKLNNISTSKEMTDQCTSFTKKGSRCKLNVKTDDLCWRHLKSGKIEGKATEIKKDDVSIKKKMYKKPSPECVELIEKFLDLPPGPIDPENDPLAFD
uniref:Uncharacterized protein n=1 Tax=Pithovirus LCPAC406 TaxID=2506599 RepID=A0A481ZDJ4_9VIRU|nr:MAG: hypothetical protein LCPAC406_03080 [Pithovirus LCPAC406]